MSDTDIVDDASQDPLVQAMKNLYQDQRAGSISVQATSGVRCTAQLNAFAFKPVLQPKAGGTYHLRKVVHTASTTVVYDGQPRPEVAYIGLDWGSKEMVLLDRMSRVVEGPVEVTQIEFI